MHVKSQGCCNPGNVQREFGGWVIDYSQWAPTKLIQSVPQVCVIFTFGPRTSLLWLFISVYQDWSEPRYQEKIRWKFCSVCCKMSQGGLHYSVLINLPVLIYCSYPFKYCYQLHLSLADYILILWISFFPFSFLLAFCFILWIVTVERRERQGRERGRNAAKRLGQSPAASYTR